MIRCRNCGEEKANRHFAKGRTICYSCKYILAGGSRYDPEYMREYATRNAHYLRYKAYVHRDRHVHKCETIPKDQALSLMSQACAYCGTENAGGLDRIDNSLGHVEGNVKPCCEKCNNILGDIPYEAKLALVPGLRNIKERGLLDQWTIPTKRKKS